MTLRPTAMKVDLSALENNFRSLRAISPRSKAMAVVKANAYGHGLVPCAERLVKAGADYLGVAFVEEGIELRKAGISTPILVFGGIFGEQIRHFLDFDLELTASSSAKLKAIEEIAASRGKRAKVHLKIDTGMERIGVHHYSAEPLFAEALKVKHCDIRGVFSHFATADETDLSFARIQLERFLGCLQFFDKQKFEIPLKHIANSAGLLQLPEAHLDMVRPGISLYGVYPDNVSKSQITLKPVMSLVSRVVYFKVVKKDAGVSYGLSWKAPEDSRIVTIPIGYGDGYSRRLSNRGEVLIRGNRYPIVGRVCMDQIMVNLGSEGEAYNGDEVVLIGTQGEQTISPNTIAQQMETIPYEVLTSINLRVPREYNS